MYNTTVSIDLWSPPDRRLLSSLILFECPAVVPMGGQPSRADT
jgi:hypothetical protein